MSRSQIHAKNDSRSYGRHYVRAGLAKTVTKDLPEPNFFLSISLTNDGNAILREIDVAHPAAKNMIELSRTQDEECGDGTTSVIVLGMLRCSHSPVPGFRDNDLIFSSTFLLSCVATRTYSTAGGSSPSPCRSLSVTSIQSLSSPPTNRYKPRSRSSRASPSRSTRVTTCRCSR